jgi:hypothetical protein
MASVDIPAAKPQEEIRIQETATGNCFLLRHLFFYCLASQEMRSG